MGILDDFAVNVGDTFGFGGWDLGIGVVGNLMVWAFLVCIVIGVVGFFVYRFMVKKVFRHRIRVYGILGKTPMLKWTDIARVIPIGRAGDKLFYLKRMKRFIPPPMMQTGINEWWFWERSDGELINIGIEDLDTTMKQMGLKFVDADMRMQRLGIEKNLQFRLQKETFWQKYGTFIVQMGFYALITILLVVLFWQWGKTAYDLQEVAKTVENILDKAYKLAGESPYAP